jgi:hypothetical protein
MNQLFTWSNHSMKLTIAFGRRILAATASLTLLAACAPAAHASFTYSVAPVTISTNFGAGSNLTVTAAFNGAASSVLSGDQIINLAQITQNSTTVPPATDAAVIPLSLTVSIFNQNGFGAGNFAFSGNINVTRSDTGGAISTFSLTSIVPPSLALGQYTYALSGPTYTAPTIGAAGNGNGGLSINISEALQTVPEPGSLALMGISLGSAFAFGLRRKHSSKIG